jgi:hypothetical protein
VTRARLLQLTAGVVLLAAGALYLSTGGTTTIRWTDPNPEGVVVGFSMQVGETYFVVLDPARDVDGIYSTDVPTPVGELPVVMTAIDEDGNESGPSNVKMIPGPTRGQMLGWGIVALALLARMKNTPDRRSTRSGVSGSRLSSWAIGLAGR